MSKKAMALLNSVQGDAPKPRENTVAGTHSGRLMEKTVQFDTIHLKVYSVGYLAMALDRSTATVRRWQRAGLIPPPIVKTKDGMRWYLKEEIAMYSKLAKDHNLMTGVSIEDSGFPQVAKSEVEKLKKAVQHTVAKQKGTANESQSK